MHVSIVISPSTFSGAKLTALPLELIVITSKHSLQILEVHMVPKLPKNIMVDLYNYHG